MGAVEHHVLRRDRSDQEPLKVRVELRDWIHSADFSRTRERAKSDPFRAPNRSGRPRAQGSGPPAHRRWNPSTRVGRLVQIVRRVRGHGAKIWLSGRTDRRFGDLRQPAFDHARTVQMRARGRRMFAGHQAESARACHSLTNRAFGSSSFRNFFQASAFGRPSKTLAGSSFCRSWPKCTRTDSGPSSFRSAS